VAVFFPGSTTKTFAIPPIGHISSPLISQARVFIFLDRIEYILYNNDSIYLQQTHNHNLTLEPELDHCKIYIAGKLKFAGIDQSV
jgi:hypothetical protein